LIESVARWPPPPTIVTEHVPLPTAVTANCPPAPCGMTVAIPPHEELEMVNGPLKLVCDARVPPP
jgi:hypothetical protein